MALCARRGEGRLGQRKVYVSTASCFRAEWTIGLFSGVYLRADGGGGLDRGLARHLHGAAPFGLSRILREGRGDRKLRGLRVCVAGRAHRGGGAQARNGHPQENHPVRRWGGTIPGSLAYHENYPVRRWGGTQEAPRFLVRLRLVLFSCASALPGKRPSGVGL